MASHTRIERLKKSIDDAIQSAPPHMKGVIDALQSLRRVAKITAVTVAVEWEPFAASNERLSL